MSSLPRPHFFSNEDSKPLRWGLFGPGWIADLMVRTVQKNSNQKFVAVAGLTPGKAEAFAKKWNIPDYHTSYEELAKRDDIDAIYIATRPIDRVKVAMIGINAGKPLLIEKPLTLDYAETKQIFDAAKAKNLLLMEAMWTRYLPQMNLARQLVKDGAIGDVELVISNFCQDNRSVARLVTPGGGNPMIDMGIYPIALSQQFLGNPDEIHAYAKLLPNKVDEETHVFMRYKKNDSRSNFVVSNRVAIPLWAAVGGSKGSISFGTPWFTPSSITLHGSEFNDKGMSWVDDTGNPEHWGLFHQVNAFSQYLEQGLLESPIYSHQDSLGNIETAQKIAKEVGTTFK